MRSGLVTDILILQWDSVATFNLFVSKHKHQAQLFCGSLKNEDLMLQLGHLVLFLTRGAVPT